MLTHLLDAKGLRDAAKRLRTTPLGDLVRQPGRASRLRTVAGDLSFDYSRHLIDEDVLDALLAIALEQGFVERRRALFAGDAVNHTEGRSALHTALRSSPDTMPESVRDVINACRSKMIRLATLLIDGVTTAAPTSDREWPQRPWGIKVPRCAFISFRTWIPLTSVGPWPTASPRQHW